MRATNLAMPPTIRVTTSALRVACPRLRSDQSCYSPGAPDGQFGISKNSVLPAAGDVSASIRSPMQKRGRNALLMRSSRS